VSLEFNIFVTTEAGGAGTDRYASSDGQTPVFMPVGTAGTVKAVAQMCSKSSRGNHPGQHLSPLPAAGMSPFRRMGGCTGSSVGRGHADRTPAASGFQPEPVGKVSDEGRSHSGPIGRHSHFFTPEHSMDVQIALGADSLHGL